MAAGLVACQTPSAGGSLTSCLPLVFKVKQEKHISHSWIISTGSPQGCVLSPLLYSLYINSCTSGHLSIGVLKFAEEGAWLQSAIAPRPICLKDPE
ncbi:hypothetical protein L3Q82_017050, partial [Scortum barcoo]